MYKTDVVRKVAKQTRLSQRVVSNVIAATHRTIEQTLRLGDSVVFPGFGTFYTGERQGGRLKDLRTGEAVVYKARRVALFRAGDVLKRAVKVERRTGGNLLQNLLGRKRS